MRIVNVNSASVCNENRIYFNVYNTMKSSVIVYSYLLFNLVYLNENTGEINSNIL